MALPRLPSELTLLIAAHLDIHSINALHQTNNYLHALLTPFPHDLAATMSHSGNVSILAWAVYNSDTSLVRIFPKKGFCISTVVHQISSTPPDEWDAAIPVLFMHGGKLTMLYHRRMRTATQSANERRKWLIPPAAESEDGVAGGGHGAFAVPVLVNR